MSQPKNGGMSDYISGNYYDKTFTFQLVKMNEASSIKKSNGAPIVFPPSELVPLQDEVYDKDKKMRRVIRYIPGETSIYKDEQTPDDKNPKKIGHAQFINGLKVLDGTDPLYIDFLMKCNWNTSNPNRDAKKVAIFKLVDRSSEFKNAINTDRKLQEARNWCYDASFDEVRAYARVLEVSDLNNKDTEEIRWNMKIIAERNPVKFMDGLKNPNMKKKHNVLEALERGILAINNYSNSIEWANNEGSPIKTAPAGVSPVDVLVDSLITPDGERFYDSLLGLLYPENTSIPEPSKEAKLKADEFQKGKPRDIISMADITNVKLAELIHEGIEKGVIIKNGAWSSFEGKKYQGEDLMKTIKGSEELLKTLQEKLG